MPLPIAFDILNTDSRKSFKELSEYTATVIFPWEHALMSFYETYAMGSPLFVPNFEWAVRLVFHKEGNLGTTLDVYSARSPFMTKDEKEEIDLKRYHDTYGSHKPLGISTYREQRYWIKYADFMRWPGIVYFGSLHEMVRKILGNDYSHQTALMAHYNAQTFASDVAYWRTVFATLLVTDESGSGVAAKM